jgi:ATP-dependent RNA helicase DOB1
MDSTDLFSFLDENVANDVEIETRNNEPQLTPNVPQKRKQTSLPGQDSQPAWRDSSKKPRRSSPHPIVLDDFETEAKREIEASAGLTGTAEAGTRLELRHQVP